MCAKKGFELQFECIYLLGQFSSFPAKKKGEKEKESQSVVLDSITALIFETFSRSDRTLE